MNEPSTASRGLLNEAQAADHLNVSNRTMQCWRLQGRGPVFVKLGKAVRYRPEDLDAYVASALAQSTTQADAAKTRAAGRES